MPNLNLLPIVDEDRAKSKFIAEYAEVLIH